jgi:Rieske Fe-S protein
MSFPSDNRRGFLAALLAGAACAVPAVTGLIALLTPWRRREAAGGADSAGSASDGFIRVAGLDEVKAAPQRFEVISERTDAWTHSVEPVGSVYLSRVSNGKILALQSKCPHEACALRFDEGKGIFSCTCHSAEFNAEGARLAPEKSQSPRDMDALECKVVENQVMVKYAVFKTGIAQKESKA